MDALPHVFGALAVTALLTCTGCERRTVSASSEASIGFVSDPQAEYLSYGDEFEEYEPLDEVEDAPATDGRQQRAGQAGPPAAESAWKGPRADELRIRLFARSASPEARDGAEAAALKLETVGFAVEILHLDEWKEDQESIWIGNRTVDELRREESTNVVMFPQDCDSAAALALRVLGEKFRSYPRAADSKQHQQGGAGVDTLIDVFPKRGVLKRL